MINDSIVHSPVLVSIHKHHLVNSSDTRIYQYWTLNFISRKGLQNLFLHVSLHDDTINTAHRRIKVEWRSNIDDVFHTPSRAFFSFVYRCCPFSDCWKRNDLESRPDNQWIIGWFMFTRWTGRCSWYFAWRACLNKLWISPWLNPPRRGAR